MKDFTDIKIILDRSGSMSTIRTDTIGSINSFFAEQRKLDGEMLVSMYLFDDQYEVLYTNKSIKEVSDLCEKTFVPRGWTALLDAIGRTITTVGQEYANMKEEDRPEKVMFVIMTDGQENSSKEYTNDKIKEMISHQTDKYKWNFVFLGANQDAIATGASIGISLNNSINFNATSSGIRGASAAINNYTKSYRSMGAASFNATDRKNAMGDSDA